MLQRQGPRLAVAGSMFLVCAIASAQQTPTIPTPSELEGRRPEAQTDPSKVPAAPRQVPRQLGRQDADIRIDIARYAVNPEAPEALKAALAELTGPFAGQGKTFADMADAAAEVTRFMQAELGYYLGYAYIPEQEPADGVIRIEVLEGRLDRVVLEWRDGLPVDKEVVQAYLDRLVPGAVLTVRDVERVVFLLNDLRGLSIEFEVRAGQAAGTAILVARPRAQQQTVWRADLDNANARTLGEIRLSGNVSRYSPFGRGDTASATLVAAEGLAFGLGSYTAPVGSDGLRLGVSASAMKYQVDKKRFPVNIRGTATTFSAFGLYPLVRSRNLNLFLSGSLDAKAYADSNLDTSVDKRVTNLNLGLTTDVRDAWGGGGLNSFDLQLVAGRIDWNVKPPTDAPADSFAKLTGRALRLQALVPGVVQGLASLRFQKAFHNLDTTEQFRAGGPDSVRALPSGTGIGDNGLLVTGELRFVVPAEWTALVGGQAIASVFYDHAVVDKRNEPVGGVTDGNRVTLAGGGIGLTWSSPQGWDLRASLARPTQGEDQITDTEERGRSIRFYVQLGKTF